MKLKAIQLKLLIAIVASAVVVGATAFEWSSSPQGKYNATTGMTEVLLALGDQKPLHYIEKPDPEMIQKGLEIVTTGRTTDANGKRTKRQSKHFLCTSCHNTKREDPVLFNPDPNARLDYVIEHNMPLLQGTTFWGMVNRESWYNDDYYAKYGALVESARDTLMRAVELCLVECSQGRMLGDYEKKALMSYFYSLEVKLGDINLSPSQYKELDQIIASGTAQKKKDAIGWLKQQYSLKSPATFLSPLPEDKRTNGSTGDPARGKLVYDNSCLHCHQDKGVTNFKLDYNKITFKHLQSNLNKQHSHYSTYKITRKGTHAIPGYKPYMPNYTEERLSHKQLEDLVAFINQQAEK